ncbi:hypothetical protein BpHYR1_026434 [Brachionus plicatilis]|uniref:Uncharacterized protein n=1 Tax=Brachionus plicatilis TaxID=10195 RepID=A0A3M7S813_BRAPC|nr:hypothetical protein BpHYR1_026434 [Brachionus plicatilis]
MKYSLLLRNIISVCKIIKAIFSTGEKTKINLHIDCVRFLYIALTSSFLRPYKISMILAVKHRKKSHFDSLVLLVYKKYNRSLFLSLVHFLMVMSKTNSHRDCEKTTPGLITDDENQEVICWKKLRLKKQKWKFSSF